MQTIKAGGLTQSAPLDPEEMRHYAHSEVGNIVIEVIPNGHVELRVNTLGDPTGKHGLTLQNVNPAELILAVLRETTRLTAKQKLDILQELQSK